MKQSFNKTDIIILALVYNYICTRELELSKYKIDLFYNQICQMLEIEYPNQDEIAQQVYEHNIEKDTIRLKNKRYLPYSLSAIKNSYIDTLPYSVLKSSLSSQALSYIGLNIKQVHTKKILDPTTISIETTETEHEKLIKEAVQLLENKGCSNIKVGPVFSNFINGQKKYKLNFSYTVEKLIIDIETTIEKYEKNLKFY